MPFVDTHHGQLHYLDVGAGDRPLLLLHAFPLNAQMWAPQVADLSASHRVIVPDLAGFGASDPMDDPRSWSMDRYVADVVGIINALDLDDVVLGGLS
ncbi:MAG: alpha/beta fold hydrolase, partial [Pseudonocardiaceae bacterium]